MSFDLKLELSISSIIQESESLEESDDEDQFVLRLLWEEGALTYSAYDIHETAFKYEDSVEGFKTLFAKIMVLSLHYPKLCNHVWQFIQQGVFGIPVLVREMLNTKNKAFNGLYLSLDNKKRDRRIFASQ